MKESKKLQKLYETYLRESLSDMDRDEMIETFVATVVKFMDFEQPAVKEQVIKILLRYENKKKAEKEEVPPPIEDAQIAELDFTSMYKPTDFDDLLQHLTLLSSSHSESIDLEDVLNASSIVSSIRKYMFDMEVPWIGIMDDMLCMSWMRDVKKGMVVVFKGGVSQLEFTYKEEVWELDFTEEGMLEEEDILRILGEAHALAY